MLLEELLARSRVSEAEICENCNTAVGSLAHDAVCVMHPPCMFGNYVRDRLGKRHPCGHFDDRGKRLLCGECQLAGGIQ
jgi:hypothetical protein